MIKKACLTLLNVLSVLSIIASIYVLFVVVMTKAGEAPSIGGYTVLRVTTGSMEPAYKIDTLLLVKKTDPADIEEGDVISFYSSDPMLEGAVNTHRVVGIRREGNHIIYTTQGDANGVPDSYEAFDTYLIGKVVGSSLVLGKVARLSSNPLIFVPIILVPMALILISNLVRTISLASKIAKDEEEQAIREMLQQLQEKKKEQEQEKNDSNSHKQ